MDIPIEQLKIVIGKRKLVMGISGMWFLTVKSHDMIEAVGVIAISIVGMFLLYLSEKKGDQKPPS